MDGWMYGWSEGTELKAQSSRRAFGKLSSRFTMDDTRIDVDGDYNVTILFACLQDFLL